MSHSVWVDAAVHAARRELPGQVRQRVQRAIDSLAHDPRPPGSRKLDMRLLDPPQGVEFYRLRMDRWRILYAVNEEKGWIWVLAIRRRPPYDYTDLSELSRKLR